MSLTSLLLMIVQSLLLMCMAPLVAGTISNLKARLQGRYGPSPFQAYRDLRKLMIKDEVVPETTGWLFHIAPLISLSVVICISLMVPVIIPETILSSDLITIFYLFSLGRVILLLASLEGGNVFGGMGSSRDAMMSVLVEPALLLSAFSLAAICGSSELTSISAFISGQGIDVIGPTLLLGLASFFISIMAENARIPFDNPSTHLELTMVHEAMILEYSGRELALMEYSSHLKLTLFLSIMVGGFLPWGIVQTLDPMTLLLGLFVFILKMALLILLISMTESMMAKMRLFRIPNLLTTSFVLAFLSLMTFYVL